MALKEGDRAPDFTLDSSEGGKVALKDLKGKKVVLYFYPKDNTPGCTREACSLRDHNAELKKAGVVVLGVSKDSISSHQNFAKKYALPFALLSDPDTKMASSYGAWGEKTLYGRKFMGMIRMTFLIDEQGSIAKIWLKVKVDTHGADVLTAVRA